MFGSNDDKKTPAPAGEQIPGDTAEKKSLFGWMRKKPQDAAPPAAELSGAAASGAVASGAPAPAAESPLAGAPAASDASVTPTAPLAPSPAVSGPAPSGPQYPLTPPVVSAPVAEVVSAPVAPARASTTAAESAEAKGLFGWMRKKPQDAPPAPAAVSPNLEVAPPAPEVVVAPMMPSVAEPAAVQPIAVQPGVQLEAASVVTEAPVEVPAAPVTPTKPGLFARLLGGAEEVGSPVTPVAPESCLPAAEAPVPVAPVAPATEEPKVGFLDRLKLGLSKASASLGEGMASLFLGRKAIDDELLDEIETRLLTADVGVEATNLIVQSLTQRVARKQLTDSGALYKALQEELTALLRPVEKPLLIGAEKKPFVILVVGVNGAGKTTTIGKLAKKLQLEGKKVMLAAGDTFRAAAVEQLQVWGERNQISVIAQHTGADSASVIFDAVQAATARGMDVLIADTAGRLHTKDNLMEELKKVRRVIGKLDDTAPHEVLLVLDAGTGQNAINQAKQFNQTVNLTGLALTKLDGTAKGGVIFALAKQFGLPIRYIGVGEGIDDLRTFEAEPFVQALFAEREQP